jgi:hypothetical protein
MDKLYRDLTQANQKNWECTFGGVSTLKTLLINR